MQLHWRRLGLLGVTLAKRALAIQRMNATWNVLNLFNDLLRHVLHWNVLTLLNDAFRNV